MSHRVTWAIPAPAFGSGKKINQGHARLVLGGPAVLVGPCGSCGVSLAGDAGADKGPPPASPPSRRELITGETRGATRRTRPVHPAPGASLRRRRAVQAARSGLQTRREGLVHRPSLGRAARAWGRRGPRPGCGNGTRPREPDLRPQSAQPPPPERRSFPPKRGSPARRGRGGAASRGARRFRASHARASGPRRAHGRSPTPPRAASNPLRARPPAARGHAVQPRTRRGREDPARPRPPTCAVSPAPRRHHTGAASHRVVITIIIFLLRSKYSSHHELAALPINNNNLRFVLQRFTRSVIRRLII